MQFRVLGSLEAAADGGSAELGPPKQQALLASLILHVGEIVSVDRLIELLWADDAPRTAAHSIQTYISDLRRAFEPLGGSDLIVTRPPGYLLDAEPDSVDAWLFERLVRDGAGLIESGDPDAGRSVLRDALALWRGPVLSEFTYAEFAQPYIHRLNEAHLEAIEIFATAELEAGRTTNVVNLLQAAALEDPLRERSRELLMLALYRSGRHAEALRTYDALRIQLSDELGVDPSPPIRRLYDRMLVHDPALLPPGEPGGTGAAIRNPYKGLRPFTESDAPDFFGRDDLVELLLGVLGAGGRLISLVGPSGSGKSSVVAAGLVPRLRTGAIPGSEHWHVARIVPGEHSLRDAEAVAARARGTAGTVIEQSVDPPVAVGDEWTLLVIDQFEQVFSSSDEPSRDRFLEWVAGVVTAPDARLRVVLTLRADYYDRPLLHPGFAAVFGPSVVNVVPMTPQDLDAAVVGPAHRVGVEVEPALLAELVAEGADRPGSLPLLQFALTELFERRTGSTLTQADYAALGGLRGLLSRQAEQLYVGLDLDGQDAATQVFLRLVRVGSGSTESRRRLALAELTDIGIDDVVLSEVLGTFGRRRLLTSDWDPASGRATIEVAHEALLVEWERLAGWIDRHRAALRRHDALRAAAEDWDLSGRDPDYLFTGSRLAEFEPWLAGGILRLSGHERAFLEAAVERRRADEEIERERTDVLRRSERRTRWRFAALGIVVVLLGTGLAYAVISATSPPPRVALFGHGSNVVFDIIDRGFDRGVSDFGLVGQKVEMREIEPFYAGTSDAVIRELRALSAERPALIVVFDYPGIDDVAHEFPDIHYLSFDGPSTEPNIAFPSFREWEASFLVGAAAALTSETGTVGVVGGVDIPLVWGFVAGYGAGARAVDPDVEVLVQYLSEPPDLSGFADISKGKAAALQMYRQGADVVFNVAGNAGLGVFEVVVEESAEQGRHLWAIGVDSDQYETVQQLSGATNAQEWRPHILTSMLKRFDLVVYHALQEVAAGTYTGTLEPAGLASGFTDISYSGGFIDTMRPRIEDFRKQIIAGTIVVPCIPDDRLDVVDGWAAENGVTPEEMLQMLCP